MDDEPRINKAETDRLWDESGREWTTRYVNWSTVKEVKTFLRRRGTVGHIDIYEVSWMTPDEAELFWNGAKNSFEVPGDGVRAWRRLPTWGAHIWRHEKERRLIFTKFS
jgi:hypothetical protein